MSDDLFINGSPKAVFKLGSAGAGQHGNPFVNRTNQPTQQTGVMPHYGGGAEKCARCSKSVYLAEKKVGAGRSFHSRCFSCQTCNRKLDATTLSEHKGEIFCKTCYTRQFGVHGLVSGVTMSTEQPAREVRHSRRSSYGSDLDAPVITHQPSRPRAHSNDNVLRGEHSAIQHDELPKMFPWRNEVLPEQQSPPSSTNKTNIGLDHLVDKSPSSRPVSQIGFERVISSTTDKHKSELEQRQSTYTGEENRHKYILEGEKLPYGNGASALIDMPVVSPPKRVNSQVGLVEMPSLPPRNTERSASPSPSSPISTNPYARQNSRERQTDISDNFSRLTLNENHPDHLARQVSNGSTTKTIASENPLLKQTSSHSSTYETSHFTATTANRETYRSRESSPSDKTGNQRTSSSTSGYASTSVHSDGNVRNSASPPSAYVPQHEYLNTHTSPVAQTQPVVRHPSSPQQNERTPSAVNNFVSKTSHVPTPSPVGKYSTLAALVRPHRPASPLRYSEDEQDFDN